MDKTLAPLYHQLADLAAKYGAQKLVLFGSRARGDNTPRSDIDLAVYGMPKQNQSLFCRAHLHTPHNPAAAVP